MIKTTGTQPIMTPKEVYEKISSNLNELKELASNYQLNFIGCIGDEKEWEQKVVGYDKDIAKMAVSLLNDVIKPEKKAAFLCNFLKNLKEKIEEEK